MIFRFVLLALIFTSRQSVSAQPLDVTSYNSSESTTTATTRLFGPPSRGGSTFGNASHNQGRTSALASMSNSSCLQHGCGEGSAVGTPGAGSWLKNSLPQNEWIDVTAAYRGEVFTNARGGLTTNEATRYTGRVDVLVATDLDKFKRSPGGVFVVHFQSLHGEGITDRFVGAQQRLSTIDGNPGSGFNLTQVSQFWWQRSFVDDLITVKIGKVLADSEFVLTTLGGDFLNTSFGWTHTLPLAAYPNPTAAVVTNLQLTDTLSFKAGLFDGAPDGGNWGFSKTGDVHSIFELRQYYSLNDEQLNGDIHVGIWYHNGSFADQSRGAAHDRNHGVYAGISQQLTREHPCDPEDAQGLGTFVQFGWAPEDRNRIGKYWGGGLVYRGLVPTRDADTCGVGIGNMTFSQNLPVSLTNETVVELFYKARLGDGLVLQPDLQYFSSPGGQNRDALALGLRFEVSL